VPIDMFARAADSHYRAGVGTRVVQETARILGYSRAWKANRRELPSDRFEHAGEEFIFILRGKAEFETKRNGKIEKWILDKGDSLYVDSLIPHRGRSLNGEAEALVVVC
jgi:mannose-6-phosphate isomerase-like protein (cupin superfamily)